MFCGEKSISNFAEAKNREIVKKQAKSSSSNTLFLVCIPKILSELT